MKNILTQQGIKVALLGKEKKLTTMDDDDDWPDIDERTVSSIDKHRSSEVIFNVMEEKSTKDIWVRI